MFENIGSSELILIFVILLLLFGSKRLSELGKGLGEVVREFRKSLSEENEKK